VLSKALTNGAAGAAAVLVSAETFSVFERTDTVLVHGETQAGTPASCAAILSTAAEFERLDAVQRAQRLAEELTVSIERMSVHPYVAGDRGAGCFRALVLERGGNPIGSEDVAHVVGAIRRAGAVVQPGPSCIQLIPAFVYGSDELGELQAAVLQGLDDAFLAIA
jgi:adenosylmethionine-8-amino-7-oxononanoate aminotransferase